MSQAAVQVLLDKTAEVDIICPSIMVNGDLLDEALSERPRALLLCMF
jgi:hypothetical protein